MAAPSGGMVPPEELRYDYAVPAVFESPYPPNDRLNGWKEIAGFLGKGVRTVQRWEGTYELPIHRVGQDGGEIVWASRDELDRWSRSRKLIQARDSPIPALAPTPEVGAPLRERQRSWSRLALVTLAISTAAVASVFLYSTAATTASRTPSSIQIDGTGLTAVDATGNPLWTVDFGFSLPPSSREDAMSHSHGGQWALADFDGDGRRELLFAATDRSGSPSAGVYAFDDAGRERFRYNPGNRRATFGSRTFSGPWLPYRIFANTGQSSFFAAFIHTNWYPTLLVELDLQGRVLAEYWSAGYVELAQRTSWQGRRVTFVGGASNETDLTTGRKAGGLAMFFESRLAGATPAVNLAYQCTDCGPGQPDEFLAFPNRDGASPEETSAVQQIKVEQNGRLHVYVGEGQRDPLDGLFHGGIWYTITPTFLLERVELASGLFTEHLKWQRAGFANHAASDDLVRAVPVRRFKAGQYYVLKTR